MGFFDRFRKREETTSTDELVNDVLLKAMLKGEKIDRDKALSLPAVSSAVDRICNTVAMIPIRLYKETVDENAITFSDEFFLISSILFAYSKRYAFD